MNPEPLPPDLRELEAQLADRPRSQPSPELRARILSVPFSPERPSRGWRLIQAAAVAVLVLNIALCIRNGVEFDRLRMETEIPRRATPDRPTDDPFQQYAASALASLRAGPETGAADRSLFMREEDRSWDTP
jgi:hypothetical protein